MKTDVSGYCLYQEIGRAAVGIGIPMGIPMGVGTIWV